MHGRRTTGRAGPLSASLFLVCVVGVPCAQAQHTESATAILPSHEARLGTAGAALYTPPDGSDFTKPLWDWFNIRLAVGQPQGTLATATSTDISMVVTQEHAVPGLEAEGVLAVSNQPTLDVTGEFDVGMFLRFSIDKLGVDFDQAIGASIDIPLAFGFSLAFDIDSSSVSWSKAIPLRSLFDRPVTGRDVRTPSQTFLSMGIEFLGGLGGGGVQLDWSVLAGYGVDSTFALQCAGADDVTLAEEAPYLATCELTAPTGVLRLLREVKQELALRVAGAFYLSALWGLVGDDWEFASTEWAFPDKYVSLPASTAALDVPHKRAVIAAAREVATPAPHDEALPENEIVSVGYRPAGANLDAPIVVYLLDGCPFSPDAETTPGHSYYFDHWSDGLGNGSERTVPGAQEELALTAYYEYAGGDLQPPEFRGVAAGRSRTPFAPVQVDTIRLDLEQELGFLLLSNSFDRDAGWYWTDYLCDGDPDDVFMVWRAVGGMTYEVKVFAVMEFTLKQGWPYTLKFVADGYPAPGLELMDATWFTDTPVPPAEIVELDSPGAVLHWTPQEVGTYRQQVRIVPDVSPDIQDDWALDFVIDPVVESWPPVLAADQFVCRAGDAKTATYLFAGWADSAGLSGAPAWASVAQPEFVLPGGEFNGLPPAADSTMAEFSFDPPEGTEGQHSFTLTCSNSQGGTDSATVSVYVFEPITVTVAEAPTVVVYAGETLEITPLATGTGLTPPAVGSATFDVSLASGPGTFSGGDYSWTPLGADVGTHEIVFHGENSFTLGPASESGESDVAVTIIVRAKVDYTVAIDSAFAASRTGEVNSATVTVSNLATADGSDSGYRIETWADSSSAASVLVGKETFAIGLGALASDTVTLDVRTPRPSELVDVTGFTVKVVTLAPEADLDPANNEASFTVTVTVNIGPTVSPPAALALQVGEPVTMEDYGATDPEGQPLYYHFDFGDGTVGTYNEGEAGAEWPTHAYDESGAYTLTVTVYDDCGYEAPGEIAVTVTGTGLALVAPTGGAVERDRPCDITWVDFTGPGVGDVEIELWPREGSGGGFFSLETTIDGASRCAAAPQLDWFAIYNSTAGEVYLRSADGTLVRTLTLASVSDMFFTDLGSMLVIRRSGAVTVHKADTDETWTLPSSSGIGPMRGIEDFISWESGVVRRYNRDTVVQSFDAPSYPVFHWCGNADGWVAALAWDLVMTNECIIHMYPPTGGAPAWTWTDAIPTPLAFPTGLDWSPDGQRFVASGMGAVALGTNAGVERVLTPGSDYNMRFMDNNSWLVGFGDTREYVSVRVPSAGEKLRELACIDCSSNGMGGEVLQDAVLLPGPRVLQSQLQTWYSRSWCVLFSVLPEDVAASTPNDGNHIWYPDPVNDAGYLVVSKPSAPEVVDGTSLLTFVDPPPILVTVTPDAVELAPGGTVDFSATVTDSLDRDWLGEGLTWSVQSGPGSIDATGHFTAPGEPGFTVVRAQSGLDGAYGLAEVATTGYLHLTSPDGGERPHVGETVGVTWDGASATGQLDIDLWRSQPIFNMPSTDCSDVVFCTSPVDGPIMGAASGSAVVFVTVPEGVDAGSVSVAHGDVVGMDWNGEHLAVADSGGWVTVFTQNAGAGDPFLFSHEWQAAAAGRKIIDLALSPPPSGGYDGYLAVAHCADAAPANVTLSWWDPAAGTNHGDDRSYPSVNDVKVSNSSTADDDIAFIALSDGCYWRFLTGGYAWSTIKFSSGACTALDVSSSRVACGFADGRIEVWTRASSGTSGSRLTSFLHGAAVTGVALVSDGLVSVSEDGALRMWEVPGPFPGSRGLNPPLVEKRFQSKLLGLELDVTSGRIAVVPGSATAHGDIRSFTCSSSEALLFEGPVEVAADVPDTGTFDWTIAGIDPGPAFRLILRDATPSKISDFSDADFAILEPAVATALLVLPASAEVDRGGALAFSAQLYDQYGDLMDSSAATWSTTGGGSVDAAGLFSATVEGGPFTVTADWTGALSATAEVTVAAPGPHPALAAAPTSSEFRPVEITFDASASTHPDGLPLTYEWDFDYGGEFSADAATGAVAATSHVYTAEGEYVAAVRVSDGACARVAVTQISVGPLPAPPTGVDGVRSASGIDLSWTASADPAVTGYNVYRSTTPGSGYVLITPTPEAGTSYLDDTAGVGVSYYYIVRAVDGTSTESPDSGEAAFVIVPVAVDGGGGCSPVSTGSPAFLALMVLGVAAAFGRARGIRNGGEPNGRCR